MAQPAAVSASRARSVDSGGIPPGDFAQEQLDAQVRAGEALRVAQDTADAEAPKPKPRMECPPGFVLYENPTRTRVRVVVRDGGNRDRIFEVRPGEQGVIPWEYRGIMPMRAPQLVEVLAVEPLR